MEILVNLFYYFIRSICELFGYSFYKEITIIGEENIPKNGPFILCGTHNSQFVDPMMMIIASKKPVNFLIADISIKHGILKYFINFINIIPVKRAMDYSRDGIGKIENINLKLKEIKADKNTNFKDQIKENETIRISLKSDKLKLPEVYTFKITEIVDEKKIKFILRDKDLDKLLNSKILKIKDENDSNVIINSTFDILPKVDTKEVFKGSVDALKNNKIIGIFPEGGSHDQTQLIEIKPGACIFSYMLFEDVGREAPIIPFGLNYFSGHRFRSKVVINIGKPINQNLHQKERSKMSGKLIM